MPSGRYVLKARFKTISHNTETIQENGTICAFVPRFQKGKQVVRIAQRLDTREWRAFVPLCALRNNGS